jgi:predicted RNA binding protein YcfA (HicA-like mRNA interferase family)
MSKSDKRIRRLFAIPPPKDFSWKELVALLNSAGFREYCDGGSHFTFEHANGYSFSMSKTHPSGILKRYQVDAAKEALRAVDALKEDESGRA